VREEKKGGKREVEKERERDREECKCRKGERKVESKNERKRNSIGTTKYGSVRQCVEYFSL